MSITSRERVRSAIEGQVVDRPPVCLWRHWPVDDQDAHTYADVTVEHRDALDLDLVKLTPSAAYLAEAWGADTRYAGDPNGVRDYVRRPVHAAADWAAVEELDPLQTPTLAREIEVVRAVRARVGPDVPVVPTVFTPISVARYLTGDEVFLAQVRNERRHLDRALEAISRTTVALVEQLLGAGACGVYYSLFPASSLSMSSGEYRDVALRHDQAVMEASDGALVRAAHFHLPYPLLELARELPANLVGWEHTRGGPSLTEGMALTRRAVIGGIDQRGVLAHGSAADVAREVRGLLDLAASPASTGLVAATSCSYPLTTPRGNVRALVEAVRRGGEDEQAP